MGQGYLTLASHQLAVMMATRYRPAVFGTSATLNVRLVVWLTQKADIIPANVSFVPLVDSCVQQTAGACDRRAGGS
jgi:hypothetical protein